jgi:hypothetical protein
MQHTFDLGLFLQQFEVIRANSERHRCCMARLVGCQLASPSLVACQRIGLGEASKFPCRFARIEQVAIPYRGTFR